MKFSELTLWFPVAVTIPLGNNSNKLSPPAAETPGLLPIKFGVPGLIAGHPGRTAVGTAEPKAFVVLGWRGSALVWKLDGKTATAPAAVSAAAPKCPAVIPPQIVALFEKLASPVLTNPLKTFDWKLGVTASRAFAGKIGPQRVVVFVAKDGPWLGKVISAILPDTTQIAQWGL